jgi:hypothetical protein
MRCKLKYTFRKLLTTGEMQQSIDNNADIGDQPECAIKLW